MSVSTRAGPPDGPSDAEIVRRVLVGDINAFELLVNRYQATCLRFATRMLGDSTDAEDAVQTAFVRAYDALGRYEDRARFSSWLFAIVVNECRALRASASRRERFESAQANHAVDQGENEVSMDPSHEFAGGDERLAKVERAVQTLEPLLREAFLMRYVQEMDYAEMARATGAGRSALKMRVKRACDALRTQLRGLSND